MTSLRIAIAGLAFLVLSQPALSQDFTPVVLDTLVAQTVGAAWGDAEGDGDLDLYVLNANRQTNHFYLNDGTGSFTLTTQGPDPSEMQATASARWVDTDGDGDLDLLVANLNNKSFHYQNRGGLTFTIRRLFGGGDTRSMEASDYDGDGDLDLVFGIRTNFSNELFENIGNGLFALDSNSPVTNDTRADSGDGCWADYDNDGDEDLLIQNLNKADHFYRNDNGTFVKVTDLPITQSALKDSGCVWGDFDNDGDLDLFTTHTTGIANRLYWNLGNSTFEVEDNSPLIEPTVNSQGASSVDYDNDGDLDLLVVNADTTNFLYENQGDGTFVLNTTSVLTQAKPSTSTNVSVNWADMDADGDLDAFVGFMGDVNYLYRNELQGAHWLGIRLTGRTANRHGVGAWVSVKAQIGGTARWQHRVLRGDADNGQDAAARLHFGLGDATVVDSLVIRWPQIDTPQVITHVTADRLLAITQDISPGWSVNPADFSKQMTVTANLAIGGVQSVQTENFVADYVAAFVGNEVRGVAQPDTSGLISLTVYANADGDTLTFQAFDIDADVDGDVLDLVGPLVFTAGCAQGSTSHPYRFADALPDGGTWAAPNAAAFDETMQMTAQLTGTDAAAADRVGAFVGAELRGLATGTLDSPFSLDVQDESAASACPLVHFWAYEASTSSEVEVEERRAFTAGTVGTQGSPFTLTLSSVFPGLPTKTISGDGGWRVLSVPVDGGMTVDALGTQQHIQGVPGAGTPEAAGGSPNLYLGYDGTWSSPADSSVKTTPGEGLLWFFFNNDQGNSRSLPFTLTGSAAAPTENVPVTLRNVTGNDPGWHLLGNPFDASLDVTEMDTWPGAEALQSTVAQVWNDEQGTNAGLGTWELALARTENTVGEIAPWEGFFVQVKPDQGSKTLTIPTAAIISTTAAQERQSAMKARLAPGFVAFELEATSAMGGTLRDRAMVFYVAETANIGPDALDTPKLFPLRATHVSAAFEAEEAHWAMQAVPHGLAQPITLPVSLDGQGLATTEDAVTATLSWQFQGVFPPAWGLALEDTVSGQRIDLRQQAQQTVVLGAPGRYLLHVDPTAQTGIEDGAPLPHALSLAPPYPNPFSHTATLRFRSPRDGDARLVLYDLTGRVVRILHEGPLVAGRTYQVQVAGQGLAAGMYLVRLTAGTQVASQTLLHVR